MANPRKFQEKIALHQQKQAEETAAFEKIMREVSDATHKVGTGNKNVEAKESSDDALSCNMEPNVTFKSGSLPNVAAQQTLTTSSSTNLEILLIPTSQPDDASMFSCMTGIPSGTNVQEAGQATRRRPSSSVGPMRQRGGRHDSSPYGSTYLSPPPPDATWRRTNSDSALHQSCGDTPQPVPQPRPNHQSRRADNSNMETMLSLLQARPRSSCDVPRVPSTNVMIKTEQSYLGADFQMPGGSLPDLTALHYSSRPNHQSQHNHYDPLGGVSLSPLQTHSPDRPPTYENHLTIPNNYHHRHKSLEQSWTGAGYSPPSLHSSHPASPKMGSPLEHNSSGYSPPSIHSSHSNIQLSDHKCTHLEDDIYLQMGLSNSPTPESPNADYYISHSILQPFQQISMDWNQLVQSLVESGVTWTAQVQVPDMDTPTNNLNSNYLSNTSHHQTSNTYQHTYTQASGRGDPVPAGQNTNIPDIILTDFSSGGELKELQDDSLLGDELRDGLDPLDLDAINLLTEPHSLLSDPSAEDEFKLDRL